MASVFISYAVEDEEFAKYVRQCLENVDISAFVASSDIRTGDHFPDIVDREINECSNLIVILTSAACRSQYVRYEIDRALIQGKRIIPCKYKTVAPEEIPEIIRKRQYFEFETKESLARRVVIEVSPETPERGIPGAIDLPKVGIKRIFPNRRLSSTDPVLYEQLEIELRDNIVKSKLVRMMGNSLRDFFGSKYADIIKAALSKGVRFRVMLLDPTSDSAKERAIVEQGKELLDDNKYVDSVLFKDIKRVTEWLFDPPAELGERIRNRARTLIELRFSPLMPTVFMIITDDLTFIEQYHIGDLNRLEESRVTEQDERAICVGGYVPFFVVENSSDYARLMESHFENVWAMVGNRTLERVYREIEELGKDPNSYRMSQFIELVSKETERLKAHSKGSVSSSSKLG